MITRSVYRGVRSGLIFSALLSLASAAQASWVALTPQTFISNVPANGLLVGDKIFSDFSLTGIASSGGAIPPSPSTVAIEGGQETSTGDYGIRILLAMNAAANQTANSTLAFKVAVQAGAGFKIKDVAMVMSGASATGTGIVQGSETVFSGPSIFDPIIANLSTSKQANSTLDQLSDSVTFSPVDAVWVRKDISVTGGTAGAAHLSEVFQTFSQQAVPEPSSVAMIGTGVALGGIFVMKRRRNPHNKVC